VTARATPLLEDVTDTARWVAFLRAVESERSDALFRDAFARQLAGERGRRIAEGMPTPPGTLPGPHGFAGLLAVRTKVFDEMILDSIRTIDADAVLNLAAGLDARPYRLALPRSLVWMEADQTQILDAKAEVLANAKAACIVERLALDLADDQARRRLLDHVAASHARVVVITEGLLVYLDERLVASLADGLRARPSIRRWVLESVAPEVVKRNMRAWGKVLAQAHAEWKFAPLDGFDFFRRHGWSPTVKRPFFVEARRLRRDREMRFARVVHALSSVSARFRSRLENSVVYGVMEPGPEHSGSRDG
jgi:methyltransferase (TIGR00027 family)